MRTKIISIIVAITLVLALGALSVNAQQQRGCCCEQATAQASASFPDASFCNQFNYFYPLSAQELFNQSFTCDNKCSLIAGQVPNAVCGDNVCDTANGESNANCPLDCPASIPTTGCAPGFSPPPDNVQLKPVKGQQAFRLDFTLQCPADNIVIERCEGSTCTNFQPVATLAPTNSYVDSDTTLKFQTNYTYKLTTTYLLQNTTSVSVQKTNNLGDIECLGQPTFDQFCLSEYYYNQYQPYLQQNGYSNAVTLGTWTNSFPTAVQQTFSARFNQAWQCNDKNEVFQGANAVMCSQNEICVTDSTGPACVTPSACALGDNPFGLFYTPQSCEGDSNNRKYCFYDRSGANVDSCFECTQSQSCYDYKTERACSTNNCGVGNCEWRDIFPDLGIGTCIDTRFNNCPNCNTAGSTGSTNTNSFNQFFEQCSDEKASALSTPQFPCFFNKNTLQGQSCDTISCADYSPSQCSANPSGITLDGSNNLVTRSNDPCNIGTCEIAPGGGGCVKNADGTPTSQPGFADCVAGDTACELDYFAPQTSIIPTGASGRYDFLAIRISDKLTKTGITQDMTAKPGYTTHLCVVTATNACNNAATFPIHVNASQLLVKNLALKDGQTVLAPLVFGTNTIKYYSKDAANNPERVKSIDIVACDNCSGPTVLRVDITDGREVQGNYYTSDSQPSITITFDEPTTVQFAALSSGAQSINLNSQNNQGSLVHTLIPTRPFTGTFTFGLDAVNSQNIGIDPALVFDLTFDDIDPTVDISPGDGTSTTNTEMTVNLRFSEQVTLDNVSVNLMQFATPYQSVPVVNDITSQLTTSNDIDYTHRVTNLANGKYTIVVDAQDFAGNAVHKESDFYIRTGITDLRMTQPSFGVFSTSPFEIEIETTNNAECRYLFDGVAPSSTGFDFFEKFDQTQGITHKINNFDKIQSGDTSTHTLHVYCKDQFGIAQRSFKMHADLVTPQILRAHAFPNPIAESDHPVKPEYTTHISLEMNEEGFCRYSTSTQDYDQMQNEFPGFGITPKKSHSIALTHDTISTFTYYVACQDLGGLSTPAATIAVSVDLNAPLDLISTTEPTSSTQQFTLAAATNKRALCYFGTINNSITTCFGSCDLTRAHKHPTIANTTAGLSSFYIQCNNPITGESTKVLPVNVFIDTTPPIMQYVDDSSSYIDDPEVSFFSDRIRVGFLAEDTDSNVSAYEYTLQTAITQNTIIDWTRSTVLDGRQFYITGLNLTEGTRYVFKVRPINGVGLTGLELESDGVIIDTTLRPPICVDTIQSGDETDIDCGGQCGATCQVSQMCNTDLDCAQGLCRGNICQAPSCTDNVTSPGFETDLDCGGQCGATCNIGQSCTTDTDCSSNFCNNNVCETAPPCRDGQLSQITGETDIDCGGSCPTLCSEGQNCQVSTDCQSGFLCGIGNTCQILSDSDHDGVPDEKDQCPGSSSRAVNPTGCGDDQIFSCGDQIHDAWRKLYFGSILCTGQGAADADPDDDGLSNAEEFDPAVNTNPTKYDTDGDGFSDRREVRAGKDPRSELSKPLSYFVLMLIYLLVMALLAGIVVAGYFGYKQYQLRLDRIHAAEEQVDAARKKKLAAERKAAEEKRKREARHRAQEARLKSLRELAKGENKKQADYVDISTIKGSKGSKKSKHTHKNKKNDDVGSKLKDVRKKFK